jgi:uroporphyrinogen-III synthase
MILITRPEEDAISLKNELYKLKIDSFIEPLLISNFYKITLDKIKNSELIITSKNAIKALLHNIGQNKDLKINTMTENISNFARLSGFTNMKNFNCKNIAEFQEKIINNLSKESRFIYLSGRHITKDIVSNLKNHNFHIEQEIIYEMMPVENFTSSCISLLRTKKIKAVTLLSKRSAEIFQILSKKNNIDLSNFKYFVLSKEIAHSMKSDNVMVSEFPNQKSLVDKIYTELNIQS